MIDFLNAKSIVIPEGEVSVIAHGTEILWQKQTKKYKAELAYLQSTGTQWIDTGVNRIMFGANDKLSFGFQPVNVSSASFLFGTMVGSRGCGIRTRNATWLQASIWQTGSPTSNNVDTIYKKFDIELSKSDGFVLDGIKQGAAGNGGPNLTVIDYFPLCIGAYVEASSTTATEYTIKPTDGRYYYLQIIQNGKMVRDFIPVLDWNDRPCMYDKVTDELFYNSGTGEFKYETQ